MTTDHPTPRSKLTDIIQVTAFLLVIFVPMTWKLSGLGTPETTIAEFRETSKLPALPATRAEISAFPAQFQTWMDDTFSFRSTLIRWHNYIKVFIFGVPPNEWVVIGQDGWFFPMAPDARDADRGVAPYSEAQLDEQMEFFRGWNTELAKQGIPFLLVLIPTCSEVYAEYLPEHMRRIGPSRFDQIRAEFAAGAAGDLDWIDMGKAIQSAKGVLFDGANLYRKLNSHWNSRGTYVAYRSIIEHLSSKFPELRPHPPEDYEFKELSTLTWNNWGGRMYLGDVLPEFEIVANPRFPLRAQLVPGQSKNKDLIVTKVDDERLPRAIMFHDSFGNLLRPFLGEHFRELACRGEPVPDLKRIKAFQPDLVILCMFEVHFAEATPELITR